METQSQYKKPPKQWRLRKDNFPNLRKFFIRKNTNWRMQVLHTYLGTVISSNGKFKANIQQLCKIASRLMYTLLSHTNKYLGGNTKLLMDLFDKIILPICTCNSEVWGSAFFTKQYSRLRFLPENQQKNPVEKTQISFLKHLLGVSSRSTNWAVLSETNSKPILCKIILKIVRY